MSSLSNAIKESAYLKARKAEYDSEHRRKARQEPMTDVILDRTSQQVEPDPLAAAAQAEAARRDAEQERLIAEQQNEMDADERQAKARRRCSRERS